MVTDMFLIHRFQKQCSWNMRGLSPQLPGKWISLLCCSEQLVLISIVGGFMLFFFWQKQNKRKRESRFLWSMDTPKGCCTFPCCHLHCRKQQKWEAPRMQCGVPLVPKAEVSEIHPKAPILWAQTWLGRRKSWETGPTLWGILLPFFVKAPRNRVLFFTQRTAERLNNKAFGCNKCVNMAQEFYIKCWQFLLEVAGLIWIFVIFSSFSTLILPGEGENALFY